MDEKTFLQTVADILETDVAEVTMESELDALGWDSLSNISFIAEVDEKTGVTIEGDALTEAVTVADLFALTTGD